MKININKEVIVPDGDYCYINDDNIWCRFHIFAEDGSDRQRCVLFEKYLEEKIIRQGPRIGQVIGDLKCDECLLCEGEL